MNIIYHSIGSASSRTVPISLEELATNVITDWMPGTPASLSRGFADMLGEILEPQPFGTDDFWTVRPIAARFEKQWKQVTSWMLGVACCRKVVEMEGYPWWAPVSAFTKRNNLLSTLTPFWIQELTHRQCHVKPPVPPSSNLLPDYVIARFNRITSRYEISFAESKARPSPLHSLSTPPDTWRNQSRNAEFFYRNVCYPATQNMVVATRVNPEAKKPMTRRLCVRAWNSKGLATDIPFPAVRDVLCLHYFGICERIGLTANARLLEMSRVPRSEIPPRLLKIDPALSDMSRDRLAKAAHDEMEEQSSHRIRQEPVFVVARRSAFTINDRTIRIGLSRMAVEMIRWLQEESQSGEEIIVHFADEINRLQSRAQKTEGVRVRADGIIGEFID